jgi:hypothetical protein
VGQFETSNELTLVLGSSSLFLRRYNFKEVLAFSTTSFDLGRFLMQSLQLFTLMFFT